MLLSVAGHRPRLHVGRGNEAHAQRLAEGRLNSNDATTSTHLAHNFRFRGQPRFVCPSCQYHLQVAALWTFSCAFKRLAGVNCGDQRQTLVSYERARSGPPHFGVDGFSQPLVLVGLQVPRTLAVSFCYWNLDLLERRVALFPGFRSSLVLVKFSRSQR